MPNLLREQFEIIAEAQGMNRRHNEARAKGARLNGR